MRFLALDSSDGDAINARFSQTSPSTNAEESKGGEEFLDELLYKQGYCIERTNAWMDSYRNVLNRFDKTLSSWKAWNYIAFMLILLKKIRKGEKSR